MTGGLWSDTFVFSALSIGNIDTITDFSPDDDVIYIENTGFFAALGVLGSSAFAIGSAATDFDQRIIYDSSTGALIYDADGSGAGSAVQFAILGTGLSLSNSDFVVI